MFGGSVLLLHTNTVGIVLMIVCEDCIGARSPHSDRPRGATAAIALLAQGPAIIDVIVHHIELPILAPDCTSSFAGGWRHVPGGRDLEGGQMSRRVRRVSDDFAHLAQAGATHDLYPVADVIACGRHIETMLP